MAFDREQNASKRIRIMDEYGYAETERYLDWFRASFNDKETRNINQTYSKANIYWEGLQNDNPTYDSPGSNVNIVNSQIESLVSHISTEGISIEVQGQEPGDHIFAKQVQQMLEWVNDKNKPTIYMDDHTRKLLKYGAGVFKVWYDPSWNKGFG